MAHPDEIWRQRLSAIEAAIEAGVYRAGAWQKLIDELRALPRVERAALADDISRVSRKLHRRRYRFTMSPWTGILVEGWAGIIGGALIANGLANHSNLSAVVGTLLWVVSFEPLVKVTVGKALGISYEYVYLWGYTEPRFKTAYGSYLVLAPILRAVFHFSGMIGSPLAAWLAARLTRIELPTAHIAACVLFWLTLIPNLAALILASAGIGRIGSLRLAEGSPTMGVIELRHALKAR